MSIPEAAQLIIQSSAIESNNNTFILEMGDSYNIYDLAKKIIKINGFSFKENEEGSGISIKITGLQPGEKVHEELALNSANLKPTIHPKINSTKTAPAKRDANHPETAVTTGFNAFFKA